MTDVRKHLKRHNLKRHNTDTGVLETIVVVRTVVHAAHIVLPPPLAPSLWKKVPFSLNRVVNPTF